MRALIIRNVRVDKQEIFNNKIQQKQKDDKILLASEIT